MKHLKKFNNINEYNDYKFSNNYITPNISKINKLINYQKFNKYHCPYQMIEYLKYDNSSYIDVDIDINYTLLNNAEHIEYITDAKFLAKGCAEGKNRLYFFIGVSNGHFYSGLGGTYSTNSPVNNDYERHIIKLEKTNNKVKLYVDNQQAQSYDYLNANSNQSNHSFYLFKCLDAATYTSCDQEKYYAKLTIDDNVLFEMIPVRIGDVGYMYDTVRKRLFGTVTNPFLLGPDIK